MQQILVWLSIVVIGVSGCYSATQEAAYEKMGGYGGGMRCVNEADGSRWFIRPLSAGTYSVHPIETETVVGERGGVK